MINPEFGEGEQLVRRRLIRRRGGRLATTLFQAALVVAAMAVPTFMQARVAHADTWSDASSKLDSFEKELPALAAITPPERATLSQTAKGSRLTEAQVAFGVGNFDTAAVLLYEVVANGTAGSGTGIDVGLYYLAESLFQKADYAAARTYFTRIVDEVGTSSRYYQASLERLVELAIALDEHTGIDTRLDALTRLSSAGGRPSAIYVRAKYAVARDDYDGALALLALVPTGSAYDFQAQYVTATVWVAKDDLDRAIQTFTAITEREPARVADRRVIELSYMALGRLHYARDLPAKAIDSYLMIDRKSDLFDETLYEVAWVYVKGKQFDKALRALELLELVDPNSSKLPTVQILEGNLRIRKAQLLRARALEGLPSSEGTAADEYDRARAVFTLAHDEYQEPFFALTAILDGKPGPTPELPPAPEPVADADADLAADPVVAAPPALPAEPAFQPADYLDQISGRESKTFSVDAEMPSIAAAWLREDPEVARVVKLEGDLGDIQDYVSDSEQTIDRLELSMSLSRKVKLFPELRKKRERTNVIRTQLMAAQVAVVDEEARTYGGADANIAALTANRRLAVAELANIDNAEIALAERVATARANYDKLEGMASSVQVALDSMAGQRAELLAARTGATPLTDFQLAKVDQGIAEIDAEVPAMRVELEQLRRDIEIGRSETAVRDEFAIYVKSTRVKARQAIGAEHTALRSALGGAANANFERIITRANVVEDRLDAIDADLDRVAEDALVNVRTEVAAAKVELDDTRREFIILEAESRAIAGEVLVPAMQATKVKFNDVVVRADVGVVDVAWSQKEDVDTDLETYTQSKQRERRQLYDEFKDILDEDKALKAAAVASAVAAAAAAILPPAPATDTTAPTTGTGGAP